ncbi:unnamed protein product [Closterium sp. NIES-54]
MMTDTAGRPQVNMLLINDWGAVFMEVVDTRMEKRNGGYIAGMLRANIKKVGAENVVVLCMDGGSNNVVACRELMVEFPRLEQAPCATHVIYLLIEDIRKMIWVRVVITQAAKIIKFFCSHHLTRGYLRSPLASDTKGKQAIGGRRASAEVFHEHILGSDWWKLAKFIKALLEAPFTVMRTTDATAKGMTWRLYDMMLQLTEDVHDTLEEKGGEFLTQGEMVEIRKIVKARLWGLACPMHVVAQNLNLVNQEEGIVCNDMECTRDFKTYISSHYDDLVM